MPDRAVTDDDFWVDHTPRLRNLAGEACNECGPDQVHCDEAHCLCLRCGNEWIAKAYLPKPRAVVAISEDRQWLVVPDPAGHRLWFVFHWEETAHDAIWMVQDKMIEDTGQSAEDVLREYLEGRS